MIYPLGAVRTVRTLCLCLLAAVGSYAKATDAVERALTLPMPDALAKQALARREQYLRRKPY